MKGKTNSQTGGIRGERVNVLLVSNQSSHEDMKGAVVSIAYENVINEYVYTGSMLSAKVPPYVDYTISVSDVPGYTTPSIVQATAVSGNSRSVSMTYNTTVVTVKMEDNQTAYNDVASAKATVSANGVGTVTLSNNGTVKVPTGANCTIVWSSISGYKTPDEQTFTANGASVTKTGTYQTEILTVNVTSDIGLPASYTITVSGIGSQTTASKVYKVPFGTSYTVSASAADGYKTPEAQAFTANSARRVVNMEYLEYVAPPVDLSMQDIYGNPIAKTTANCYVIKEAGRYQFPLVFGNAIVNGSTNSAAYTKNRGVYSHDFVDYNGTVISSPYIETVSGTASSAQLSIADTDGIFSDISIISGSPCRFVQFKVNSIPAEGANGVISIKNSSGTIMWSWHIWAWPHDLTPIEITNSTGVKYNIMPVNLATKLDTADSINKTTGWKNWFYQFGRTTPVLCQSTYNSTSEHASFGSLSYATASAASDIQRGIQNPTTFYKYSSSYHYNWFQTNSGKTYNLWDAACTSTGNSDNDVVKTVYDPCPVGWKVPNGSTFTGFSKTNVVGSFSNGWKFKRYSGDTTGVFFPASGYRGYSSGSLSDVGSGGIVWLSSAYSQDYAYNLYFYSSLVSPQFNRSRAYGFSVRPVQE